MADPTGEARKITVEDRVLEVLVTGPEDGPVVVFHTGTPSAGRPFAGWTRDGAQRGVRHVCYARPGYAGSTRAPGRTVADCTADVAAIADALGVERFHTVGWSGGGPHALACAALLGERVIATAVLAGVAPYDADGLNWLDGMGEENVEEFRATQAGAEALRGFLEPFREELSNISAADVAEAFGDLLSEVDRRALTGEFAEFMAASSAGAVENGIWGWLDDDLAFVADWGFELSAAAGPVSIWQGGQDRMVPFAHGRWLAANIRGAAPHLREQEGHITIVVDAYGAVLDDLLARGA